MKKLIPVSVLFLLVILGCGSRQATCAPDSPAPEFVEKTVIGLNSKTKHRFVNNYQLYQQGWDTLPQLFWQKIFMLSHDSMIVNVAAKRQQITTVCAANWHCQSPEEKNEYKRNLSINSGLDPQTNLFVTSGKKFFFEFRKALPFISRAIPIFEQYNTDPWYAQTILLIESPGKTEAVSSVGARGPFQLMPYVARKSGLVVTKYRDDRTDLEKSAGAAARFLSSVCIPLARKMMDERNIPYNEKDLWFRLLVMHVYHAGAGNVAAVLNRIQPQHGGMELIRSMWVNEAAGFKNESQNYSQIALAAILTFDQMISRGGDQIYLVEGDRMLLDYKKPGWICVDTLDYLSNCISAYENDLVEGMIPYEYFLKSTREVRAELSRIQMGHQQARHSITDETDRLFRLGNQLLYKRKYQEAISVFEQGLEIYPFSSAAYDSLGKAYRSLGKNELAVQFTRKSKELIENPDAFVK
jgi:hypothetical protein